MPSPSRTAARGTTPLGRQSMLPAWVGAGSCAWRSISERAFPPRDRLRTHPRNGRVPSASTEGRLTLASATDCETPDVVVRHDCWSSGAGVCDRPADTSASNEGRRRVAATCRQVVGVALADDDQHRHRQRAQRARLRPDQLALTRGVHNFRAVRGLKARILDATDEDEPDEEFDREIFEGILPRGFTEPPPGEPQRTLATCRLSGNIRCEPAHQPA